ncbi:VCBS repeat-containing protein [Aureitalea marina]|uniref:FG-GAP repeat domain-containing protein n=1 Tax=Aureitalea marina TaxID=930804 RepID=UPI00269F060E
MFDDFPASIDGSWIIADLDGETGQELLIPTMGGDMASSLTELENRYYTYKDGQLVPLGLELPQENTQLIRPADYDRDGDLDLFIGNYVVTNQFGKPTDSRLLINQEGKFQQVEVPGLAQLGMITDAVWDDFDQDGYQDLIVVGEWMEPRFFKNTEGQLAEVELLQQRLSGLWQMIIPFDIDADGDTDYVLGNWGENSKFRASNEYPMRMYVSDFDDNGALESVVSTEVDGYYYPLLGLDELAGQMVFLRKKFTSYADFAGLPLDQVFDDDLLQKASLLEVNILSSGFLRNNDGEFNFEKFNENLQIAPVRSGLKADFDKDGAPELLLAGNFVDLIPFHGRLDSFGGALIHSDKQIDLGADLGLNLTNQVVSDLELIELNQESYLLVLIYDGPARVYRIK